MPDEPRITDEPFTGLEQRECGPHYPISDDPGASRCVDCEQFCYRVGGLCTGCQDVVTGARIAELAADNARLCAALAEAQLANRALLRAVQDECPPGCSAADYVEQWCAATDDEIAAVAALVGPGDGQ